MVVAKKWISIYFQGTKLKPVLEASLHVLYIGKKTFFILPNALNLFLPFFSSSLPPTFEPRCLFSPAEFGLIWSVSLAGLQHLCSFHLTRADEACRHFATACFRSRRCFLESSRVPDCCLCHSISTRRDFTSLSPHTTALPAYRCFQHLRPCT